MSTLAIDFDGCLHDYMDPIKGKKMGLPIFGAVDAMEDLRQAGHKLIIHTVKATTPSGKQAVIDWLEYYGIEYHDVTAIKPNAELYIDDRGYHFTDWRTTLLKLGVED